ncbi:MAG TPA: LysR family transcriptional regulator [Beijerinckiaceae bacterium]|jgi:DNA-binding transcriptional LysR family regulator|nr:LysR family transcriptional regulator [Beijerinckiaceae bacterium]
MIDPKLLLIFAKAVECGSITAAARVLGMPKATVSRAIARVEALLAVRLLERSSRRFRVTEAGALLFQHCQRIAEEIDDAEATMATLQGAARGRLRVAAPYTFSHFLLSPVLGEFLSAYPDIQFDLELTNRRVDPVEEAFDFVVRVGALENSEMIVKTLGNVAYGLFAHVQYLRTAPPLHDPSDLANHPLIGSFAGAQSNRWAFTRGDREINLDVGPSRLNVNDPMVRLDAMAAGLGIALLPDWLVRTRHPGRKIRRLLPEWKPVIDARVSVLYPDRRSLTPRSRAFLTFLNQRIAPVLA